MPLDTFTLGGMTFDGMSTPGDLPIGGRHQMHVHKLPGGTRVIDCVGPDDEDRHLRGTFWGEDALAQALTMDAMRKSGAPVPYFSGVEFHTVVVAEFRAHVERFNVVHYDVALVITDGGVSAGPSSSDDLVGSDLSSAKSVTSSNAAASASSNFTPVTTPVGSGPIGSA